MKFFAITLCSQILLFAITPCVIEGYEGNVLSQGAPHGSGNEIVTSRTRAYLSCESGDMVVKINFSSPFQGLIYAYKDRTGPCSILGTGGYYYEIRIPLKGCGTRQEAPREFINNVTIRFHRALELEDDEIKTVVCRYPPPVAPPPNKVIAPVTLQITTPNPLHVAGLTEIEILLIICALLFLSLLTLGLGIAYFCLKKRNIRLIRKKRMISSGPDSEITKLSATTLGNFSFLDPIRIPRAVASSTRVSEGAPLTMRTTPFETESISSDYPSESTSPAASDMDDGGKIQLVSKGAAFGYRNEAFEDSQSISRTLTLPAERQTDLNSIERFTIPRVKNREDQTVTTALEPEELVYWQSWNRNYAILRPDIAPPVRSVTKAEEAPVYAKVKKKRRKQEPLSNITEAQDKRTVVSTRQAPSHRMGLPSPTYATIHEPDQWSGQETESSVIQKFPVSPVLQVATITDYYINKEEITEVQDTTTTTKHVTEAVNELQNGSNENHRTSPESPSPQLVDLETDKPLFAASNNGFLKNKLNSDIDKMDDSTGAPKFDVVIRHYPPPLLPERISTSNNNGNVEEPKESNISNLTPSMQITSPPIWDVIIRSIPPSRVESRESESKSAESPAISFTDYNDNSSADESQVQDHHFSKSTEESLKQHPLPKNSEILYTAMHSETSESEEENDGGGGFLHSDPQSVSQKITPALKTVTWPETIPEEDDNHDIWSDLKSLVSDDSYLTDGSNGERSTSEVLELVPTMAQKGSHNPVRSKQSSKSVPTSKFSKEDNVDNTRPSQRPILERYSPGFIESIPVGLPPTHGIWTRDAQPLSATSDASSIAHGFGGSHYSSTESRRAGAEKIKSVTEEDVKDWSR